MDLDVRTLWDAFHRLRDGEARRRLVEHYMPFARMIAAKLYGLRVDPSLSFDDYLQYAHLGLIESIDRFDAGRSASFETYSGYRIRGAILNGIVRGSEAAAQVNFWKTHVRSRLDSLQENMHPPAERASLQDIANLTVDLALGLVLDGAGVEAPDEAPTSNPYAATELAQFAATLRELVQQLPPRERDLIQSHYFDQLEFQWIAERLSVTKGRVSQLHAQALTRLREMLRDRPNVDRKL